MRKLVMFQLLVSVYKYRCIFSLTLVLNTTGATYYLEEKERKPALISKKDGDSSNY